MWSASLFPPPVGLMSDNVLTVLAVTLLALVAFIGVQSLGF